MIPTSGNDLIPIFELTFYILEGIMNEISSEGQALTNEAHYSC